MATSPSATVTIDGRISKLKDGVLRGWMIDRDDPDRTVVFSLRVNNRAIGVLFKADRPHNEDPVHDLPAGPYGFKIPLRRKHLIEGRNLIVIKSFPDESRFSRKIALDAADLDFDEPED